MIKCTSLYFYVSPHWASGFRSSQVILNCAVMNILEYFDMWTRFSSLGYILQDRMIGHKRIPRVTCWEIGKTLSKVVQLFCIITDNIGEFLPVHTLIHSYSYVPCSLELSCWVGTENSLSFGLGFPQRLMMVSTFPGFCGLLVCLLTEVSIQIHFLFLFLDYLSVVFILNAKRTRQTDIDK